MGADMPRVDAAADQGGPRWVLLCTLRDVQALVGKVAEPWGEVEPQQVHPPEPMVCETGCIGVVLLDP